MISLQRHHHATLFTWRRARDISHVDHVRLAAYTSDFVARPRRPLVISISVVLRPVTTFLCTPHKRYTTESAAGTIRIVFIAGTDVM